MKTFLLVLVGVVSIDVMACRMVCSPTSKSDTKDEMVILCGDDPDGGMKVVVDSEDIVDKLTCKYDDPNDRFLSYCTGEGTVVTTSRATKSELVPDRDAKEGVKRKVSQRLLFEVDGKGPKGERVKRSWNFNLDANDCTAFERK